MSFRTNDVNFQFRSWLIKAVGGLVVIGAGASMVSDAAIYRNTATDTWSWILYGTAALIVFNAGICILGDAVKHRTHYERLKDNDT
ncbi:MAG: hypothetical protein AAF705_19020 [Bacteroidota bacterium]